MPTCPYCNHEYEYCNDDGFDQDDTWDEQCPNCEKYYRLSGWYEECFSEAKADCLNGAPHDFQKTHTYPVRYAVLRCTMCGAEKPIKE